MSRTVFGLLALGLFAQGCSTTCKERTSNQDLAHPHAILGLSGNMMLSVLDQPVQGTVADYNGHTFDFSIEVLSAAEKTTHALAELGNYIPLISLAEGEMHCPDTVELNATVLFQDHTTGNRAEVQTIIRAYERTVGAHGLEMHVDIPLSMIDASYPIEESSEQYADANLVVTVQGTMDGEFAMSSYFSAVDSQGTVAYGFMDAVVEE